MLDLAKFYNNIDLIYSKKELDDFNLIYVSYYTKAKTFDELINHFPTQLHPIIKFEYEKQYNAQKGIQGGILVELTILATIAKIFNINSFSYENGKYIYENNEYRFVLQGNMGHGQDTSKSNNDIIIFDKINNKSYNCEVKEPFARLKEKDFLYDEDGHLCPTKKASKEEIKPYIGVIKAFNNSTSVFEHYGHNIPITAEMVAEIIEEYFLNIDYLLTYQNNKLVIIPNNKTLFSMLYNSNKSEIRGVNGKNLKVIFTPIYAKKILNKYLIKEDKDYYYFNLNSFIKANSRQSDGSRFKLIEGFAIKNEDAIIENNVLKCQKNKFKQNSPLISPKIKLIADYNKIKQIILEGGYNIEK